MEMRYTGLAPFYAGWDRYQSLLCAAIAPLSAEQLALRPAPSLRSVGEIASHIVGARARWFQIDFGEGGPEIEPLQGWDAPGQPARRRRASARIDGDLGDDGRLPQSLDAGDARRSD